MTVKLSAVLTKETREFYGLDAISDQIVKEGPDWVGYAVVELRRKRVTHEDDAGVDVPTVYVAKAEPVFGEDAAEAARMRRAAYDKRTGRVGLWNDEDGLPNEDPDGDYGEDDELARPIETVDLPDGDVDEPSNTDVANQMFGEPGGTEDDELARQCEAVAAEAQAEAEERAATADAKHRLYSVPDVGTEGDKGNGTAGAAKAAPRRRKTPREPQETA